MCVSGLISKYALPDEQGFALGTLAAVQSIVSVLGPASENDYVSCIRAFDRTSLTDCLFAVFGGLYGWGAPKGGQFSMDES